jgi:hypothetical protein
MHTPNTHGLLEHPPSIVSMLPFDNETNNTQLINTQLHNFAKSNLKQRLSRFRVDFVVVFVVAPQHDCLFVVDLLFSSFTEGCLANVKLLFDFMMRIRLFRDSSIKFYILKM